MIKNTRKKKREKEEKINFFEEFIKVKKHFFQDILKRLKTLKDIKRSKTQELYRI